MILHRLLCLSTKIQRIRHWNFVIETTITGRKIGWIFKISLSVQKSNYAVKMYEKVGFTIVDENNEEYIMIVNL